MSLTLPFILTVAAVAGNGLLVGASLDQSLKQLPARHRIGAVAYAAYARAADLGNGLVWYTVMPITTALVTIAAAVAAVVQQIATPVTVPLVVAGALTILHYGATSQAAPTMISVRHAPQTEEALSAVFDRFTRWQMVRAILQVLTLAAVLWALIAWFVVA